MATLLTTRRQRGIRITNELKKRKFKVNQTYETNQENRKTNNKTVFIRERVPNSQYLSFPDIHLTN